MSGSAVIILAMAVVSGPPPSIAAEPPEASIVFVSDRDGNAEIYSMNEDGSDLRRLTNDSAVDTDPEVSPDGTRIAYVSYRSGNADIYLMTADGSARQRLTFHPKDDLSPSWSPDGTRLVFASTRGEGLGIAGADIYTMAADGSRVRRLTHSGCNIRPSWSPLGDKIAFSSGRADCPGDSAKIYTMDADGENEAPLEATGFFASDVSWSPDGTTIAYATGDDFCESHIHLVTADGSALGILTNSTSWYDFDPTWSPDGSEIAFSRSRVLPSCGLGQADIYHRASDAGDPPRRLTTAGAWDYGAHWWGPKDLILALGDSVAAGHGHGKADGYPNNEASFPAQLGSRLGWASSNFAITGACAATAGRSDTHAHTPGSPGDPFDDGSCSRSILHSELPVVAQGLSPSAITLTIGMNDIQFSDCFLALLLGDEGDPAKDPCTEPHLGNRLTALDHNLELVLAELRERYPMTPIVLSEYYNPLPLPPLTDQQICPAMRGVAIIRDPLFFASTASAEIGERNVLWDARVRAVQTHLYTTAETIRQRVNAVLRAAASRAGASTFEIDFMGNDMCTALTGGDASQTYVYGPSLHATLTWRAVLAGGSWNRNWALPSICTDQTYDPDPIVRTAGESGLGFAYTAFLSIHVNCAPHPTTDGHRAIAAQLERYIASLSGSSATARAR